MKGMITAASLIGAGFLAHAVAGGVRVDVGGNLWKGAGIA